MANKQVKPNPKLEAALLYASLEWSIIPLHSIVDGKCTCKDGAKCLSPGKHPHIKWSEFEKRRATEKEIRAWWAKWPDANPGGLTGAISGNIVLDVDGPQGVETLREHKYAVPPTVRQETGGDGWHHMLKHPGFECRNFAGKIGHTILPNVDFRGDGGLVVLPPSNHKSGGIYKWIVSPKDGQAVDAPNWLLDLIRGQMDGTGDQKHGGQGKRLTPDDWGSDVPEGQRNAKLTSFAGSLLSKMSVADALPMLLAWNRERCKPPLPDDEVKIIVESISKKEAKKPKGKIKQTPKKRVSEPESIISELNKKHCVLMVGGKCAILNETYDYTFNRPDITFSSPADFKNFYANRFVKVMCDDGIERNKSLGNVWFQDPDRRQYDGITFAPLKETPGQYNLWKGFGVQPKEGDCSLYLEHLRENIAQGNEEIYNYIIAWMADAVQHPAERPGTSIVLRGRMGSGKGVAISEFGKIFGHHFVQIHHTRHLVGNFNAHLKDVLLVFADEAFWAGDKSAEGVLKAMVTEEYMQIEPKGKDSFRIKNHIRLMIASNNDWVVPAGLEERRFFILDVGEKHMQDHEYFRKIVDQMNNGGREALLCFLQHYELSTVNLRKFPMTEALYETKEHSMTPLQKFWSRKLVAGALLNEVDEWSEKPVSTEKFIGEYYKFSDEIGHRYKEDDARFGIGLRKLVPWIEKHRPRGENGTRYDAYLFPPLEECRLFWENLIKITIKWSKEGASLNVPMHDFIDDDPIF